MSRRLKQVGLAVVVVLIAAAAAAQLVRPDHPNPATDVSRTLEVQVGATSGLVAVVDRACGDCHSNATVWARYPSVAPLSWVIARGVTEGRKAVNMLRPEARLSTQDVETICAASRDGESRGVSTLHSSSRSTP